MAVHTLNMTLLHRKNTLFTAALMYVTIIKVSRNGIVYTQVSGTPEPGQFKYNQKTAISFSMDERGNVGGEPVTIVYKD